MRGILHLGTAAAVCVTAGLFFCTEIINPGTQGKVEVRALTKTAYPLVGVVTDIGIEVKGVDLIDSVTINPGDKDTTICLHNPANQSLEIDTFWTTYTYASAGQYQIKVTAWGIRGSVTDSISVQPGVGPSAPLGIQFTTAVAENQPLVLNVTATGSGTLTYEWFHGVTLIAGASSPSLSFSALTAQDTGKYQCRITNNWGSFTTLALDLRFGMSQTNQPPLFNPLPDQTTSEGQTLSFTVVAVDPDNDPIRYSVDTAGLPPGHGATFDTLNGAFNWTPGFNDSGSYQVIFTAADNTGKGEQRVKITVANVNRAPTLKPLTNVAVATAEAISFTASAVDPDGDTVTYTADLQGLPEGHAASIDTKSGVFSWTPAASVSGTFPLVISASDGSLVAFQTVYISVGDVNRPPAFDSIAEPTVNEGEVVALSVTVRDPENDKITLSVASDSLPDSAAISFDSLTGAFSWQTGYADAGSYPVRFIASDGNFTVDKVVMITVRNVNRPPVLSPIGSRTGKIDTALSITVTATDPDNDSLTYSVRRDSLPPDNNGSFDATTRTFSWKPRPADTGNFKVIFSVSDGSAADGEEIIISVGNVNHPPQIMALENVTVTENQKVEIALTAVDADGDAITFGVDKSKLPAINDALFDASLGTFSWTPTYSDAGSYTLVFSATDGKLSDDVTLSVTVTNVNRAPTLASIGDKTVAEGSALAFTAVGTDPDGEKVTYAIDKSKLPPASTAQFDGQSGVFSWTPAYTEAGAYEVTITATDGSLSASQKVNITVTNTNRLPQFAAISEQNASEGQKLSFTIAAVDPDNDPLTYSATMTTLPEGNDAAFDTTKREFSWTPGFTDSGSYSITFKAKDGIGETPLEVKIKVANVNRVPVLAAIGNKEVAENATLTFTIAAEDADGEAITYSANLDSLPAAHGATFTPSTRTFSWTPNSAHAGNYPVTFSASDGQASDEERITITVGDVDRPPQFAAIADQTVNENQQLSFSVNATDPDGDAVTITANLTMLPTGHNAVFDPTAKTFTWTPTYQDSGVEMITFTATSKTLSTTIPVQITVVNVKCTPVVSQIPGQSIAEGGSFATIKLNDYVSDCDHSDAELVWMTMPTNFNVSISTDKIATITPKDPEWNGSESITFTARDPDFQMGSVNAVFTVDSVNDAPKFVTKIPDQTVNENSPFPVLSLDNYVSDVDNSDAQLTWTHSSSTRYNISINSTTHQATITVKSASWYGSETIAFTATDPKGAKVSDTVVFKVNFVNDAPVIVRNSTSVSKTAYSLAIDSLKLFSTDEETSNQDSIIYTVTALPTTGVFKLVAPYYGDIPLKVGDTFTQSTINRGKNSGGGTSSYITFSVPTTAGTANLSFTVSDGAGGVRKTSGTFRITIY